MSSPSQNAGPATAPSGSDPRFSTAWSAMSSGAVLDAMQTNETGLSTLEAEERLKAHGPNALPTPERRGFIERMAAQFNNVLILTLIAASAVTAVLGHWVDTAVILAVVLVNAAVGFWQEGKAESALAAVRDMLAPEAMVSRDGQLVSIPTIDLVPGDIVLLDAGDRVPADLRLIRTRGLRIDEAALTGESVPVSKSTDPSEPHTPLAEQTGMAFSGTLVTSGQATGVVTATGDRAEIGKIGVMLGEIETLTTPLIRQIDQFGHLLTRVILLFCIAGFAFATTIRDYTVDDAFLAMVGMAVAAIPEGLPAVITITLALGVQRMALRRAIIRRLPAVETLGGVSVICTDKTGTLTLNEMCVRTIVPVDGEALDVSGDGYAPQGQIGSPGHPLDVTTRTLVETAMLASRASIRRGEENDRWIPIGDPMDAALVALGHKAGLDVEGIKARQPILDDIPFDSANRYNAILTPTDDMGEHILHLKGAPDKLFEICTFEAGEMDPHYLDKDKWLAQVDALAAEGKRVLAFARKPFGSRTEIAPADMESGFTLLGLAGFVDPPRHEAAGAIATCQSAGIRVKMITGDHAVTALAIARDLNMQSTDRALTGVEIDGLSDEDLRTEVRNIDVYARATPEHKLRLISALQSHDEIVSMTGDGVNDAPALKRANVGVAMGIKGTEAAKSAAEVVLTDDNFASIAEAVREGRIIFENIKKVIGWILPTNGGESIIIVAAILMGITLPLAPLHILWINMITAVALGLTLAFEPAERTVMQRRPRTLKAPLIDGITLWRVLFVSVMMAVAAFAAYFWALDRGNTQDHARTLVVNTIVMIEIFYLFAVRAGHGSGFRLSTFFGSRAALIGIAVTVVAQALFTYFPALQGLFETRPLGVEDFGLAITAGALVFLILESEKRLRAFAGLVRHK